MSNKETFIVYLNSYKATNIVGSEAYLHSLTYNLPWSQIIPDKYRSSKFLLRTSMITDYNLEETISNGYITAEFGSNTVTLGDRRSNFIATYGARFLTNNIVEYYSDPTVNFPVVVGYPTNENVKIDFIGGISDEGIVGASSYQLVLSFTLVD